MPNYSNTENLNNLINRAMQRLDKLSTVGVDEIQANLGIPPQQLPGGPPAQPGMPPAGGAMPPAGGAMPTGQGGGAVDPNTGMPIDQATGLPIDPNTGLPIDPTTGAPMDPAAQGPDPVQLIMDQLNKITKDVAQIKTLCASIVDGLNIQLDTRSILEAGEDAVQDNSMAQSSAAVGGGGGDAGGSSSGGKKAYDEDGAVYMHGILDVLPQSYKDAALAGYSEEDIVDMLIDEFRAGR
jgi:hypothetical protein